MAVWLIIDDESCPNCGDSIEVKTALTDGGFYDGDDCRCSGCNFNSCMSVDEDGSSWIQETDMNQTNDHHTDLLDHLESKGTPEQLAEAFEQAEEDNDE